MGRSDLAVKVATRYFVTKVIEFRPKKRVPTLTIGGRKYLLSDYFLDLPDEEESSSGARLINVGPKRFSYLWVYDTDRKVVSMWRVSDGDNKAHGPVNTYTREVLLLDRRGQLNRVTNQEYREVERWMDRQYDATMKHLKKIVEENKNAWDHKAKELVQELFETKFLPDIERRWKDVDRGLPILGFKVKEDLLQWKSAEQQAKQFIVNQVLEKFTEKAAYDYVERQTGVDPYDPPDGDNQAVQWAFHEVLEDFYDSHRGEI